MPELIELQRSLYSAVIETLKEASEGPARGLLGLFILSIAFGLLHALMPGHGKSILVSFHAGRRTTSRDAALSGALLTLTHVGSAVVIVVFSLTIIRTTFGGFGRAPVMEQISAVFIIAIGAILLWRSLRNPTAHLHGSGQALAVAAGFMPCPLTVLVMSFAITNGMLLAGTIAVSGFAVGMTMTICAFPVAAVVLRERSMNWLARSEPWRVCVGRGIEIASAIAVVALGIFLLAQQ